ncbi:MAG: hypothetical protein QOC77_3862 [Thermoleophilaceae bacterium]|nr:hypothetical protein [Thermoleophilaceae bacterium]
MEPTFFETPEQFRAWLEQHHESERELLVGFYRKGTGRPSITWPQSVDEALCFGWIDGIRRSIDHESYSIRFTPRKPTSNWSSVNIARVAELAKQGRMRPAGTSAFERRSEARSGIYSYEQRMAAQFGADQQRELEANDAAWRFFQAQPRGYRRTATYWVVTAKRDETRRKRLATLIEDSAAGRRLRHLSRYTSR